MGCYAVLRVDIVPYMTGKWVKYETPRLGFETGCERAE